MTKLIRINQEDDKLQKYRDFYAGVAELDPDEKKYLDRYERVMLLIEQNQIDTENPIWTRAGIVKYVREHYKVSIQMSNRIVNEAIELFGDMQQLSLRAKKAFRVQHLEHREKEAIAAGDHAAAARINDQINKILGTYADEPDEKDDTDYSVPAILSFQVFDSPYELIPDIPQPMAASVPPSPPTD